MANVRDVADYLLQLSGEELEPTPITPMQLQKLLYYVQGWSIAMRGDPMFVDRIEAWAHGPVVPGIYQAFSYLSDNPIPVPDRSVELPDEVCGLIKSVWAGYKSFSASGLRNMTHREVPWMEAREGFDPGERCNQEISQGTMQEFFREEYDLHALPGLEFEKLELAEVEFANGGGIRMEEVFS